MSHNVSEEQRLESDSMEKLQDGVVVRSMIDGGPYHRAVLIERRIRRAIPWEVHTLI